MPKTLEGFAIKEIETLRAENKELKELLASATERLAKKHEEKLIIKEAFKPKLHSNYIDCRFVWEDDPHYETIKQIFELKENENE